MSRRSVLPQGRRHIWVYDEDWEFLTEHFGPDSPSKMGVGPSIRNIVHIYVKRLRAKQQELIDQKEEPAGE